MAGGVVCSANMPFLGYAFQVAQVTKSLHWIVKTLKDSGFGSAVGAPGLGEWGSLTNSRYSLSCVALSLRGLEGRQLWGPGGKMVPKSCWISPGEELSLFCPQGTRAHLS